MIIKVGHGHIIVIVIFIIFVIFVVLKFQVVSGEVGEGGGGCCADSCCRCCGGGQELSGQAWCAKEHCWMIKNSRRAMQILVDCFFFHFLFRENYRGKRDRISLLWWS